MSQILFVSFWNPTKRDPFKGIFIHEQLNALCRHRKDVIFAEVDVLDRKTLFQVEVSERSVANNRSVIIRIYSVFWKFIYLCPWLLYYIVNKELKKKFADLNPDIVHSNVIFPCGIVGHYLSKRYKARHIVTEHWSKAVNMLKHPLFKSITRKAYRDSEAILCVSEFLANRTRLATGHPNLVVVPNIIAEVFCYKPKLLVENTLQFTCIAVWRKPKRLDLIVNSLIRFASETGKHIKLNVIGEGEDKDALINTPLPANLQINWAGHVQKPQIAEMLSRTNYFLHASEIETFSVVTVEALSTGTPVLASNAGAIPELIHPGNGLLVDNTEDEWLEGLHRITKISYNYETIAGEFANRYSPDAIGRQINELYNLA